MPDVAVPVPASAYATVTWLALAALNVTVNVRFAEPLSPSFTLGESIDSVGKAAARTVTSTVSAALSLPARTSSRNVSVASAVTLGAVKLGVAVVEPVRLTFGLPPVWLHE